MQHTPFLLTAAVASALSLISCHPDDKYRSGFEPFQPGKGKEIVIVDDDEKPGQEQKQEQDPAPYKIPARHEAMFAGTVKKGQLELADPFIFVDREDSLYYAMGTANPKKGYKLFKSPDLKRWMVATGNAAEGFALYKTDVAVTSGGTTYSDDNFWAPELYRFGDKYYLYYTAAEHIYVAQSTNLLGPYRQNSTGFTPDAKGIDCSVFVDDDGTPYMYWVRFDGGNVIYAARLEDNMTSVRMSTLTFCLRASQDWEKIQGKITEGPTVFRHNGLYYMVYSANHFESQDYGVGVATATSPLGPWTKYADNPILRRPGSLLGTGHSSVFTDLEGNLRLVFHAHNSPTTVTPRLTYSTSLSFTKSGGVDKLVASPDYSVMERYAK